MKVKLFLLCLACLSITANAQTKSKSVYDSKTAVDTLVIAKDQLQEVVVKGNKCIAKRDGNFVVFPEKKDVEMSAKAIELLELMPLPGLSVDRAQKSISIDGGTPIYMINGREVTNYRLMNINPKSIKRIEYSNTPSVRYLDRGAKGIINIILKDADDGGSVVTDLSSDVEARMADAYLMGSYHKGKNEISVEYNMNHRDYSDVPYVLFDTYNSDKRKVERETHQNAPFHYTFNYVTAEFTRQQNDSTMFVASLRNLFYKHKLNGHGVMNETDRGVAKTLEKSMFYRPTQYEPKLDLFYSHKLPANQKIEANVVAEYSSNSSRRRYDYVQGTETWSYPTSVLNHGWALSAEAVYGKQFKKVNARFGVQYQHNYARNNYDLDGIITKMTKDNTYGFAEIQGSFGEKLNYTLGTGVKLFSVKEGDRSKSYVRNLSNLRLNYRFSSNFSLSGDVSFTPNLPSLSDLSSVMQRVDDVEASKGNPQLKPSENLNTRVQLHFSKGGWHADFGTSYYRSFSPIIMYDEYDEATDLFVSSFQNASLADNFQVGGEVGVKDLFKHFNISLSGSWEYSRSKGDGFSHSLSNFSSHLNFQAFVKNWRASANFNLTPQWNLAGEMLSRSERAAMIGLSHNWKHISAGVVWHCPFNKDGYQYESKRISEVHTWHGKNWTGNNGNMVVFNLSWNLNFGKAFSKGQKTLWNGGYDSGTVK